MFTPSWHVSVAALILTKTAPHSSTMRLLLTFAFAALARCVLSHTDSSKSTKPPHFRHHDKNGAVASEASECSRIGVELIKEGGNAADAVGRHRVSMK